MAACAEATEFLYSLKTGRGDAAYGFDLEIRVMEELLPLNMADLPAGITEVPSGRQQHLTSPAEGEPVSVIGGTGFNDAAAIGPGTYETELVPGEMAFFALPLEWGQQAVFSVDGPDENSAGVQAMEFREQLHLAGDVYAPDFSQIDSYTNRGSGYMMHGGAGWTGWAMATSTRFRRSGTGTGGTRRR